MNKLKDDQWLDELIFRTINAEKPQFDAELWKQKFPDEFKTLQSRAAQSTAHTVRWIRILKKPALKFTAAAAIIIPVIVFFMIHSAFNKNVKIVEVTDAKKSPAEMLTLRSLKIAYRNGGIEAVEIQCDDAIEKLIKKPERITFQKLLTDIDGV